MKKMALTCSGCGARVRSRYRPMCDCHLCEVCWERFQRTGQVPTSQGKDHW